MRFANINAQTCTFCYILFLDSKGEKGSGKVAATHVVPLSLVDLPHGGFTFTYVPGDTVELEPGMAGACNDHYAKVTSQIESFRGAIQHILGMVEQEEDETTNQLDELHDAMGELGVGTEGDGEDGIDLGMDEEDAEAVRKHLVEVRTQAILDQAALDQAIKDKLKAQAGTTSGKVIPTPVKGEKQPQPSKEERAAMVKWHFMLPADTKLAFRLSERGNVGAATLKKWRETPEYEEFVRVTTKANS